VDAPQVLINLLDGNRDMVQKALDGLTPQELAKRPTDQCNSVGWLVWHIARAEDALVSAANKSPQLWVKDGWAQKFGMPADAENSGFGHGAKDLASFKAPSAEVLKGYWAAAENKARDYIRSLKPQDLDKQLPSLMGQGTMSLAAYVQIIVNEAIAHGGQVAYLRGLHRGIGWYM